MKDEKRCPFCGAALHPDASFCPFCAKIVNERQTFASESGRPARKKLLRRAAAAVLVCAALWAVWMAGRPRMYDEGGAEAFYTDRDGTYQFCIAWANSSFTPSEQRYSESEVDFDYRYPVQLYINHAESDSHAAETFLQKVDHISAEIVRADEGLEISCLEPERRLDYVPEAAAIVLVDYRLTDVGHYSAELAITVHLKNGDAVRVRQELIFDSILTHEYSSADAPMDTVEQLQALIDEIEETVGERDVGNIRLPPVTYTGGLTLDRRPINLIGSVDDAGNRTAFTGTILLLGKDTGISYYDQIDFLGGEEGVGISASTRLHLTGCRVSGWKTGVLCYGNAWVNADETVFEENETAFHFNSIGGNVSDTIYDSNVFRGNGTAVLLESVPADVSLKFPGTVFERNGTDFDNQCRQELNLSGAVFR